jgi:hypothetical protein
MSAIGGFDRRAVHVVVFTHPGQPIHDTAYFPANSATQLVLFLVFSHLLFLFRIERELTRSLSRRTFRLE